MTSASDPADSEYEYEYSHTETETFYVDLDLSSLNAVKSHKSDGPKSDKEVGQAEPSTQVDTSGVPTQDEDEDQPRHAFNGGDAATGSNEIASDSLQILDLHTSNPLVAYHKQIYSCRWVDILGTNLYFSNHQPAPVHEPCLATEDYDLVAHSRIKLVGQKARIIPKLDTRKRKLSVAHDDFTDSSMDHEYLPSGHHRPTDEPPPAAATAETRVQSEFLEKLAEVKRQRGDNDAVRTFVDKHTVAVEQRQRKARASAAKEEAARQKEIDTLNKRVVGGDHDALERLQEIYGEMEDAEESNDEDG